MSRSLVLLLILVTGCMGIFAPLQAQDATPEATPSVAWPAQYYAPYVNMGSYPVFKLSGVAKDTGVRYFTLAFVLTGYKNCKAAWFGVSPLDNSFLLDDLKALRAMGGDVIVSFGGASGSELAQYCPDVDSLAVQYQTVVDTLNINHLDFDIEGGREDNADSVRLRSQALARLQAQNAQAGNPISISFTLPVLTTGLTEGGLSLLQSAIDEGVQIDVVNIMTMNFEDSAPVDRMADNSISAAKHLVEQLKTLYPDKTDSELWRMVGITPMIGVNDRAKQIFTLDDAAAVTQFAIQNHVGRIGIWSLERDKSCPFEQPAASPKCSSIQQAPFAFSTVFNQITG